MTGLWVNRKTMLILFAALMIAIGPATGFLPSVCMAGKSASEMDMEAEVVFKKIQPAPEFEARKITESGDIKQFFDVVGTVSIIDDDYIVLGDREFSIARDVRISGVKRWDRVGLRLNKSGKVLSYEKLKDVPH